MAYIASVGDLGSKGTALPYLTHELRVQSDTDSSSLVTYLNFVTVQCVKFLSQGKSMYLAGVGRELFKD